MENARGETRDLGQSTIQWTVDPDQRTQPKQPPPGLLHVQHGQPGIVVLATDDDVRRSPTHVYIQPDDVRTVTTHITHQPEPALRGDRTSKEFSESELPKQPSIHP
jgi:hypothetical protein